jgi:hypothetical protein
VAVGRVVEHENFSHSSISMMWAQPEPERRCVALDRTGDKFDCPGAILGLREGKEVFSLERCGS